MWAAGCSVQQMPPPICPLALASSLIPFIQLAPELGPAHAKRDEHAADLPISHIAFGALGRADDGPVDPHLIRQLFLRDSGGFTELSQCVAQRLEVRLSWHAARLT
jgi:hypothetical protein